MGGQRSRDAEVLELTQYDLLNVLDTPVQMGGALFVAAGRRGCMC